LSTSKELDRKEVVEVLECSPKTVSGGRRGFYSPAPTDPGVTVSPYPALVILVIRRWGAC
jgi:hypothetical protein